MPILITNNEFTDEWGNVTSFYRSNAGDRLSMKLTMRSSIVLISAVNPMIFNPIANEITSSGVSFEAEGFRTGDTVSCLITDQNGTPVLLWSTFLEYVNGYTLKVNTLAGIPDPTLMHQFRIQVTGRNRKSIECFLNHVDNAVSQNDFSLIDGEATRFKFSTVDAISIGSTQNAEIVGNQSGQYLIGANLKRISNINANEYQYELTVDFVNSGIYDPSWFDSSDCLKSILKMLWSSLEDEPYEQTQIIYNDNANTGWFDQAHNSDSVNATLVQGVTEIDYATQTSFTLIVDGVTSDLGIGASYIPLSDAYYKNKIQSQNSLGMVIPTSELSVTSYDSFLNPVGAGYSIEVDAINTIGTTTYIDAVFVPNSDFSDFMDLLEDGDRGFKIWVKCGNLNLLAFDGQLTKEPPVGGELIMYTSKAFYDHADNTNDGSGNITYPRFDTEDDLSYFGKFLMEKNGNYDELRVRIEAFNTDTNEDFTLQETLFSFSGTQINSNGVYLLDQSISINSQLPTTSLKRDAVLKVDNTISTIHQFGVSLYYPVILDWRYWLQQVNADADFYPNQNKNWQQYAQSGDWIVRMELELIKDGLAFTHTDQINILGYNAKAQISSSIQYIKESDGSIVTGLIDGEIMRIKATHVFSIGIWTPLTWGMITIEPKEGSPRWISSTVLDYDNNSNNPLYPLPGETKAKITITGDTVTVECLCDTTKLSGDIQSVTAKIKDPEITIPQIGKIMADGTPKVTADGNRKVLA
jgi:hypothetical protein